MRRRRSQTIDPIELYAAAIDSSDYVARVAPLIRQRPGKSAICSMSGPAAGSSGHALRAPNHRWTAIEPSARMRARLARFDDPPFIIASGWDAADVLSGGHDTVLAANIAAPLQEPNAFLLRCLTWARRTVIWVVPAQHGPRGMCFAGCLPASWHGEDETPGIDVVLRALAPSAQPHSVAIGEWTFSGIVADVSGTRELSRRPAGLAGQPSTGHERASRPPGETRCGRLPARHSETIRSSRVGT